MKETLAVGLVISPGVCKGDNTCVFCGAKGLMDQVLAKMDKEQAEVIIAMFGGKAPIYGEFLGSDYLKIGACKADVRILGNLNTAASANNNSISSQIIDDLRASHVPLVL